MRRSRHRQRSTSEKRAAQIRRPAARAADHASRRPLEWGVALVDHAGRAEHLEGVSVAGDMQLIARRPVERAAMIGADLRADPVTSKQCERPTGGSTAAEIEMQRPVARCAKVQAAGRVEERRELGPLVAAATGRDSRELLAHILGGDQMTTPSRASNRRLTPMPVRP